MSDKLHYEAKPLDNYKVYHNVNGSLKITEVTTDNIELHMYDGHLMGMFFRKEELIAVYAQIMKIELSGEK